MPNHERHCPMRRLRLRTTSSGRMTVTHGRVRQRGKQGAGDFAELILTSQTWHDIVWKHQLFLYRPAKSQGLEASAATDRRRKLV